MNLLRTSTLATIFCLAVMGLADRDARAAPHDGPHDRHEAPAPQAASAVPVRRAGSMRALMAEHVGPAADALWAAVSTSVTATGVKAHATDHCAPMGRAAAPCIDARRSGRTTSGPGSAHHPPRRTY